MGPAPLKKPKKKEVVDALAKLRDAAKDAYDERGISSGRLKVWQSETLLEALNEAHNVLTREGRKL